MYVSICSATRRFNYSVVMKCNRMSARPVGENATLLEKDLVNRVLGLYTRQVGSMLSNNFLLKG